MSDKTVKDAAALPSLVDMMSHELRSPLASVIGYAEMLLEGFAGDLNEEQRNYVGTILKKGESLLYLINQILDLSRAEGSQSTMRRELTEMQRLLLVSLEDVKALSAQRDIHLESEIDAHVTPISVDPEKVRRILVNLLTNAIKFTPPGGKVTLRVDVVTEPDHNKYLRIRVSDTGVGIAKDQLERIFEAFYQVDHAAARETEGTGLGLSIVRGFAQAHRGRVDVESVEGEGSTFSVRLPYGAEDTLSRQ